MSTKVVDAPVGFVQFVWKNHWWQVLLGLALTIALLSGVVYEWCAMSLSDLYSKYIDPLLSLGTLAVAILVWVNEKREAWRSSLPKKLNIFYLLPVEGSDDKWRRHVTVLNAPLAGENDIRNWGQSIGKTILGTGNIDFCGFRYSGPIRDKATNSVFYDLVVYLNSEITDAEPQGVYVFDSLGKTSKRSVPVPDNLKAYDKRQPEEIEQETTVDK